MTRPADALAKVIERAVTEWRMHEPKTSLSVYIAAAVATHLASDAVVEPSCPFCGRDPFHYVDNGLGMEAVAVTCCDLGDKYFRGMRPDPETVTLDWGEFVEIGGKLADRAAAINVAWNSGWESGWKDGGDEARAAIRAAVGEGGE